MEHREFEIQHSSGEDPENKEAGEETPEIKDTDIEVQDEMEMHVFRVSMWLDDVRTIIEKDRTKGVENEVATRAEEMLIRAVEAGKMFLTEREKGDLGIESRDLFEGLCEEFFELNKALGVQLIPDIYLLAGSGYGGDVVIKDTFRKKADGRNDDFVAIDPVEVAIFDYENLLSEVDRRLDVSGAQAVKDENDLRDARELIEKVIDKARKVGKDKDQFNDRLLRAEYDHDREQLERLSRKLALTPFVFRGLQENQITVRPKNTTMDLN